MRVFLFSFLLLVTAAPAAMAYIGPGPGLSMLGTLLALLGGVVLALLMVLAYPIRLLLKRRKAARGKDTPQA